MDGEDERAYILAKGKGVTWRLLRQKQRGSATPATCGILQRNTLLPRTKRPETRGQTGQTSISHDVELPPDEYRTKEIQPKFLVSYTAAEYPTQEAAPSDFQQYFEQKLDKSPGPPGTCFVPFRLLLLFGLRAMFLYCFSSFSPASILSSDRQRHPA